MPSDQLTFFGRTYPESSTTQTILLDASLVDSLDTMLRYCRPLQSKAGTTRVLCLDPSTPWPGASSTPNISESPNDARESTLSAILETGNVPRKYFLSPTACRGILRRAEKRGKKLPEQLARALKAVADSGRISICKEDCKSQKQSQLGGGQRQDAESETLVTHPLKGEAFDGSEDGSGRGVPLTVVSPTLRSGPTSKASHGARSGSPEDGASVVYENHGQDSRIKEVKVCPQINAKAGTGGGNLPIVLQPCGTDNAIMEDKTGALKGNCDRASGSAAVISQQNQRDEVRTMDKAGALSGNAGMKQQNYVAFTQNQAGDVLTGDKLAAMGTNQNATGRNTPKVQNHAGVRRLMPTECEKLQAFEPGYTNVPHRGKPAADGPRYKAIGNSWTTTVPAWIGRRIEMVEGSKS